MKTIKKLKLNHLCENELDEKQLNTLKGGCGCTCWECLCQNWDGTGSIPPGLSTSDHGSGSVAGNLAGTVNHGM